MVRKIASLYHTASRDQDALAWAKKALAGFEALGASGEVELYKTLHLLSDVYFHLDRFQGAVRVQRKVTEGFERTLGAEGPSSLRATLNWATYRALERKEDALKLYERALKGYEARVKEVRNQETAETAEEKRIISELKGKIREAGGSRD
ncbi:uncharacterized protein PV07_06369 [Cladophialophora immunda]|uniref:MalT-like TPR region domain-containing protein n=1 Tax=Cladophialophora immunda TaxID=569365 RepID=A0A0D1ZRH0_9EURO|nr:uncharacterized protein PV07_06369 [Cladophialophora immunda]KIW30641.1 hypothetical protein PV07_06369 [Cladophialophora immunda]